MVVRRAESSLKPLAGSIRSLCSLANTPGFGEKADLVSEQLTLLPCGQRAWRAGSIWSRSFCIRQTGGNRIYEEAKKKENVSSMSCCQLEGDEK